MTTFYREVTSTETQRPSKRATMSHRPRSSPTAHLADRYYERLVFSRDQLSSLFGRREEGAERGPVQRASLDRNKELAVRQMFQLGMFVQRAGHGRNTHRSRAPRSGKSERLRPSYADGIMVHADCYLVINGKEGHPISMSASLETQRSIYDMEPLSAGSTTSRENPQHE